MHSRGERFIQLLRLVLNGSQPTWYDSKRNLREKQFLCLRVRKSLIESQGVVLVNGILELIIP